MALVTQRQENDQTVIEVRWRHRLDVVVVLGMSTFIALISYIVTTSGAFQSVHKLPLLGAAIATGYYLVAQAFNRTTLRADNSTLMVENGPLPWWPRRRSIPREQVKRLWCDVQSRRLCLRTKQGQEHELLAALPKPELEALTNMIDELMADRAEEPSSTPQ